MQILFARYIPCLLGEVGTSPIDMLILYFSVVYIFPFWMENDDDVISLYRQEHQQLIRHRHGMKLFAVLLLAPMVSSKLT